MVSIHTDFMICGGDTLIFWVVYLRSRLILRIFTQSGSIIVRQNIFLRNADGRYYMSPMQGFES
jgi:hypothetical protein